LQGFDAQQHRTLFYYLMMKELLIQTMDFNLLRTLLEEHTSFLLTTHVNPDADAIGSEIAMYNLLKRLGKEIRIVNTSHTPYYLEFMDSEKVIEYFDDTMHQTLFEEVEVLVALDFNRSQRLVRMEKYFTQSPKVKICIDHHEDPENFVNHFFTNTTFAATGQILYDFINSTGIVEIDLPIANALYAAIMTDTGSFRFDRTTDKVHLIAADLLAKGVKPNEIYVNIYDTSRIGKIKLLGEAIQSLQLYGQNKEIAVMTISQEALQNSGADETDTDGFVNLCLTVDTVKIALKFLELKDGFKVSLRSKGEISVQKIASEFGGGGHRNASGIRVKGESITTFKEKLLTQCEAVFQT